MAKLLLVEDDNNLREIYQARLAAEGYDILAAQNGEEALVIAKQQHPDLIISDVMMPRISGFEMLDILRNTPELRDTKVIMLTALGQAEDQARAGKLGADKYLVKSQVTLEDIVKCAEDLINGAPAEAPAPPAVEEPASPQLEPATVTPVTPLAAPTPTASTPNELSANPVANPAQTVSVPTPAPITNATPPNPTPVLPAPAPTPQPDDTSSVQGAVTGVSVADPDPLTRSSSASPSIVTHRAPMLVQEVSGATDATSPGAAFPAAQSTTSPSSDIPSTPQPAATQELQPSNIAPLFSTPTPEATQSIANEEAVIASQIEAFAGSQADSAMFTAPSNPLSATPPLSAAPVAPDTIANLNDTVINNAVDELKTAADIPPAPLLPPSQHTVPGEEPTTEPVSSGPQLAASVPPILSDAAQTSSPVPQPVADQLAVNPVSTTETPETTPPSSPGSVTANPNPDSQVDTDQVNVAGKKVIRPINDIAHGPDLNDLLAKEAAKETAALANGISPVAVGSVAPQTPDVNKPDPNSIAL